MPAKENLKLDEEFITAWNQHDVDRALKVLSDDVVWRDIASSEPMKGKEQVRSYLQSWFTAFPDLKSKTTNRVANDDQIAAELEFSGTNKGPLHLGADKPDIPATGKTVTGKGTYFVRIRDGKAVEIHTYPDNADLMTQLGVNGSKR